MRERAENNIAFANTSPDESMISFTNREIELILLIASGEKTNDKYLAEVMTISENTVSRHFQNIFAKMNDQLGVKIERRTQIIGVLIENGILELVPVDTDQI